MRCIITSYLAALLLLGCGDNKPAEPKSDPRLVRDRLPNLAKMYSPNDCLVDAVYFTEPVIGPLTRIDSPSNLQNCFRGKLVGVVSNTQTSTAMLASLPHVLFTSNPSQIFETIVGWITVQVSRVNFPTSGGSGADKSCKNQHLNLGTYPLSVDIEKDFLVTSSVSGRRKYAGGLSPIALVGQGSNATKVGNVIPSIVPNYGLPNLFGGHV